MTKNPKRGSNIPSAFLFCITLERQFYESGEEGTISSPDYPSNYGIKKNHYWRVKVPEGKRIEVNFDGMDIEYHQGCEKDFLKVYDGSSSGEALLRTYCGKAEPEKFTSSGRYLYLHFRSDDDGTRKGFQLSWKAFDVVTPEGINGFFKLLYGEVFPELRLRFQ